MTRIAIACLVSVVMLSANALAVERPREAIVEIVGRLENDDERTRARAEARLIGLGAEAVDALVDLTCRAPSPSRELSDATLRILARWEQQSWNDPGSAAAIDRFVELVREPQNCPDEHLPLSPRARLAFAETVRVLDVSPDEAAAYLRGKKGIKIGEAASAPWRNKPLYTSIHLTRHWVPEPKDWLYIANLAREIDGRPADDGKRHALSISITGRVEADTLVECFKYFRKSRNSPFDLFLWEAPISRDALLVLATYPEMTGILANEGADGITDEIWAECILAWPNAVDLMLLPAAGQKAIAAASKLDHLIILRFRNVSVTEADLQPFRNDAELQVLWVWDGKTHTEYLNQRGTGKWQLEEAGQSD